MAHADPLSLPQARERYDRAVEDCLCIADGDPIEDINSKRAARDAAWDDLLVAASSPQRDYRAELLQAALQTTKEQIGVEMRQNPRLRRGLSHALAIIERSFGELNLAETPERSS